MLLSLKWLREFVPLEASAQELGDRLTMLGLELEDILHPYDGIKTIVVGHVLTKEAHPDSDHLAVCTVDVGQGEPLTIVCGAPNVAAGQKVPVALVGTTMPGGMVIKKAKLRGVPSFGMICSERELGLTDDHSGIMVLPEAFRVGDRLVDALDLDTEILEIGITPNRGDCLSVLGLAREAALAFKLPLTMPKVHVEEKGADWTSEWSIGIPKPELCPFYQLRLVEGVTVKPSPAWMRYRLHAVGVRPISNIVDITNYVLMELGQPLHAFDRDKLEGGRTEISLAREGERIVTLDGQERVLTASDLLIRDGVKPVALAGVMGGLETEISDASRAVMVESAVFRPETIRKTARRQSLPSEASYRFERGVDQGGSAYAMNRAVSLMAECAGGVVRTGACTLEPKPWIASVPTFRVRRAVDLLGMDVEPAFCADTLERLGCALDRGDEAAWKVTTPSWRQDLSREVDLIEEIARVKGMDTIPETLPAVSRPLERFGQPESRYAFLSRVKAWGSGLGLNEAENYSFVGHKDLDHLGLPKEGRIDIINPLTEEQNVLRTALAPSLLQNVRTNIAHGNMGVRLFEVANVFEADAASQTTAKERARLGLVMYGSLYDTAWPHAEMDAGYADIRGLVEHFAGFLHLAVPAFIREAEHPAYAPCVRVEIDGRPVGLIGQVKPQLADAYHARKPVWLAELDLETLWELHQQARIAFRPLAVFPPSRRDVTVIAPTALSVSAIEEHIRGLRIAILEDVTLIDLYEPKDTEERNLTFRLTFRKADRTLKDAEVDKEREKVAQSLVKNLGVRI
ncbi:MAG TPA: phenylalanine--tRNA ligase subunit beta [Candidatus Bilophila faecipullorum]|uniref:Phenylalanine--tRNA ligase beta subunit n=1 Tax=Candidatus Bilophila faecipullorum TaxID=2838482 RepID=A0A9D1R0P5_9BACT|nr:phenylalanine--tRNA ligase subunit beta [uncultured Bilophila sp.]HIW78774.1 phenylalanine--tRNA ligase subunit beta [Candidatus Bilophila faecipullorum]